MTVVLFSLATFFSTLAGGLFALKFNDRLHYILSFTAGVLLGVVSFDILPEIFSEAAQHSIDPMTGMIALVVGFLFFHSLEKILIIHHVHDVKSEGKHHPKIGVLSALTIAGHSFMDGVGIGLGFQISNSVGITVAVAVIAHDFCDGLNTVGLMLIHRNTRRRAFELLLLDAIAPVLGAASTLAFNVPTSVLVPYLGFFAGFLLYIGASDILPEAHSRKGTAPTAALITLTGLGAASIYLVVQLAE